MFARAAAGGLGYGDVKKDLLARLLDYFEPMRARRAELEAQAAEIFDEEKRKSFLENVPVHRQIVAAISKD